MFRRVRVWGLWLAALGWGMGAASPAMAQSTVRGYIDGVQRNGAGVYQITGWACATDINASIDVHLYVGGQAGTGTGIGAYTANLASSTGVAAQCQAQGTAYRFSIPLSVSVRQQHANKAIYLHGISPTGGSNLLLDRSGEFAVPTPPFIKGHVDGVITDAAGEFKIRGWACSTESNASINVHFYAGGPAGSGTNVGSYPANVASEAAVATSCQAQGTAYRFLIPLTAAIRQSHGGKGIYIHGISPISGSNLLIANSGVHSVPPAVVLTRRYVYDTYQQLCKVIEPETGATVMAYDGAGNLSWSASGQNLPSTTDCNTAQVPTNQTISRVYDARNRVTALTFPDGKGNQSWTYTPDGLPATVAVTNPNVSTPITTTYTYNRRRLPVTEATKISTPTYTLSYGYNANGHLSSMTYPNTTVVGLAPNALGQPTQAGSYATGVQYYPNGALKQFTYGNGIIHTMTQNARQLPARSTDSSGALDLGYGYDKHANVSAITDYTPGGRQTRAMSYDGLDRLTQTTSAMFGTASYGYNALDNLTSLQVTGGNHARNYGYVYDGSNRLTNITNGVGGASIIGLGYDPQGNVVNKNGQTYEFDYGNRLRRATNKEWYAYDGHGRRVLSCTPTACDYQQYGADGKLYFHQDNRNGLNYVNVYLGGSLVAIREQPTAGGTAVVKYQHTDALGTPIAETDANKAIIRKSEYEPYGQLVNRPLTDGPGFTGHVQDAATGLTYMQQRYYDPGVGRFLSVDPINAIDDPVGYFNRYVYAKNSPYRFTDPDGRGWFDEFLPPPSSVTGNTNPYAPIPGADRGDKLLVGGLAATATLGAGAALAVPAATTVLANPAGIATAGQVAAEAAGVTGVAGGVVVTGAKAAAALAGSTMQTSQKAVSLPVVQRYVNALVGGSKAPAIKADGKVIVDGNHRYVAGRIVGREPDVIPGSLAPSQGSQVQPVQQLKFDPTDWGND